MSRASHIRCQKSCKLKHDRTICNQWFTFRRVWHTYSLIDDKYQIVDVSNFEQYLWFSCSICMIKCIIIRQLIWKFNQDFRRISEFLDWIRNRLFRNKVYSQIVLLTLENHSCIELLRRRNKKLIINQ